MSFSMVSYFPELIRVRDALEAIKSDWEVIQVDFAETQADFAEIQLDFVTIENDITKIKTLGSTCSLGINTTSGLSRYGRALAMMSVIDEEQYQDLINELNNPTPVPNY